MAGKRRADTRSEPTVPLRLTRPRSRLEQVIQRRIERAHELAGRTIQNKDELRASWNDYQTWDEYNETLLRESFNRPDVADEYARSLHALIAIGGNTLSEDIEEFRDDVSAKMRRLQSVLDRLELLTDETDSSARQQEPAPTGKAVFVVHGRADSLKQETARFLERLGIAAVILHERPNQGRTVIEKFEDHAREAGFAVVLLTADDEGGPRESGPHEPRARQNVVFELGFFFGALGRGRVAVLYERGVELPSDIDGLVYIELDSGGAWKVFLSRELRQAGFDVDLNRAI